MRLEGPRTMEVCLRPIQYVTTGAADKPCINTTFAVEAALRKSEIFPGLSLNEQRLMALHTLRRAAEAVVVRREYRGRLAVNVRAEFFRFPLFADHVLGGLLVAGLTPSRVILDLLEGSLPDWTDPVVCRNVTALAESGIEFALNGYGHAAYRGISVLRTMVSRSLELAPDHKPITIVNLSRDWDNLSGATAQRMSHLIDVAAGLGIATLVFQQVDKPGHVAQIREYTKTWPLAVALQGSYLGRATPLKVWTVQPARGR
jgi:hypothetical protein